MSALTHIMYGYLDGFYTAKLYMHSVDTMKRQIYDLCCVVSMDPLGKISVIKRDTVITEKDIALLRDTLMEYIFTSLQNQNPWIQSFSTIRGWSMPTVLQFIRFLELFPTIRSYEWFYVGTFLLEIKEHWSKRIILLGEFSDFIKYIAHKHQVKSVLRSLYKSVNDSIVNECEYNPLPDFIICRSFDDPNIVTALLNLPIKQILFTDIEAEDAIRFFRWLQKYYSAASIIRSLASNVEYCGSFYTPVWIDTMYMVSYINENIPYAFEKYFQKSRMNERALNDEMIRIHSCTLYEKNNKVYVYNNAEYCLETQVKHLRFVLVKNRFELYKWSESLHNCLFDFDDLIEMKKCYIIGVFIESELKYAVEFDGKNILQAYGKYNRMIIGDDQNLIYQWVRISRKLPLQCAQGVCQHD